MIRFRDWIHRAAYTVNNLTEIAIVAPHEKRNKKPNAKFNAIIANETFANVWQKAWDTIV